VSKNVEAVSINEETRFVVKNNRPEYLILQNIWLDLDIDVVIHTHSANLTFSYMYYKPLEQKKNSNNSDYDNIFEVDFNAFNATSGMSIQSSLPFRTKLAKGELGNMHRYLIFKFETTDEEALIQFKPIMLFSSVMIPHELNLDSFYSDVILKGET
jgi:hypothetical protein